MRLDYCGWGWPGIFWAGVGVPIGCSVTGGGVSRLRRTSEARGGSARLRLRLRRSLLVWAKSPHLLPVQCRLSLARHCRQAAPPGRPGLDFGHP